MANPKFRAGHTDKTGGLPKGGRLAYRQKTDTKVRTNPTGAQAKKNAKKMGY